LRKSASRRAKKAENCNQNRKRRSIPHHLLIICPNLPARSARGRRWTNPPSSFHLDGGAVKLKRVHINPDFGFA
jgi:hypothetical protein